MISKIIYHSKLKINKINPNIFLDVLIEKCLVKTIHFDAF